MLAQSELAAWLPSTFSSQVNLPLTATHFSWPGKGCFGCVMRFHAGWRDSSRLICRKCAWSGAISVSPTMASTGHSATQIEQSMHSSGLMTRKLGPSMKQFIGQTLTQSVYLHWIQLSVTTKVILLALLFALGLLTADDYCPQQKQPPFITIFLTKLSVIFVASAFLALASFPSHQLTLTTGISNSID